MRKRRGDGETRGHGEPSPRHRVTPSPRHFSGRDGEIRTRKFLIENQAALPNCVHPHDVGTGGGIRTHTL